MAVAGGVDWIQVRARELEDGALLDHVDEIRQAVGGRSRVLVNRRVDVALAASADGVHLGFDGMPPETARQLLGGNALIGIATHHPGELAGAAGTSLSYAHLAPIFPPLSRRRAAPLSVSPPWRRPLATECRFSPRAASKRTTPDPVSRREPPASP
jgi:thiamine-phosphate pyrophosphorylase